MKIYKFSKDQRLLIEGMRQPFAICQFIEKGVMTLAVSDGFCKLFGYTDRAQAYSDMNQNMFKDTHPDDTAKFVNAILRFGTGEDQLDVIYRTKKKSGSGYKVIHVSGEHVDTEEGLRLAQIWFTDEGDYEEENRTSPVRGSIKTTLEKTHEFAARYDYLTGLPNMSYFFERADFGRKLLSEQGRHPALLYIDLSGMKSFNHKYGFSEGDKLLRYFASLLAKTFDSENCCHVSADRFAAYTDENGLEERLDGLFRE